MADQSQQMVLLVFWGHPSTSPHIKLKLKSMTNQLLGLMWDNIIVSSPIFPGHYYHPGIIQASWIRSKTSTRTRPFSSTQYSLTQNDPGEQEPSQTYYSAPIVGVKKLSKMYFNLHWAFRFDWSISWGLHQFFTANKKINMQHYSLSTLSRSKICLHRGILLLISRVFSKMDSLNLITYCPQQDFSRKF